MRRRVFPLWVERVILGSGIVMVLLALFLPWATTPSWLVWTLLAGSNIFMFLALRNQNRRERAPVEIPQEEIYRRRQQNGRA